MQFFEVVLILLALPLVLRPILPFKQRWNRLLDVLAAAVLLLAAVNFLLEIAADQAVFRMVPAYLIILVTGIPAVIRLIQHKELEPYKSDYWAKAILGLKLIFGLLLWSFALALPVLLPMKTIPLTGPYGVDSVTYEWTDPQREETYTDAPGDLRKIAVQFWYPVDPALGQKEKGEAVLSSTEPAYPVLIFSHGATGLRLSNTSTYRELASHGYVVASIDHTYLNLFTRFSNGDLALISQRYLNALNGALAGGQIEQEMMAMYQVRVADMRFTLDQIEAINQAGTAVLPAGHLNLQQIGLFGHSAGATTAAEACRQDNRCQAAVLLDGTMVFDILEIRPDGALILTDQPFPRPMMQINSGLLYDSPRYQDGYAPNRAAFDRAVLPSYNLVMEQASHMNLTDLPLLLARPVFGLFSDPQMKTGPIDPKQSTQALNAYVLAFFDQYLKGIPSPLLQGPSSSYPFVRYRAK